ncbi:MAG: hypothetical protein JNJ85_13400 [Candidatus Kapabacteria bacterium]|nr:hypothetical protein [Candidatus Kapabacteria bacterium]
MCIRLINNAYVRETSTTGLTFTYFFHYYGSYQQLQYLSRKNMVVEYVRLGAAMRQQKIFFKT